jgi:hypothetical protein
MATFICPDCKKKVSDKAETCPNCGRVFNAEEIATLLKSEKKTGCSGCGFLIVIVLVVAFFFLGGDKPKEVQTTVAQSVEDNLPEIQPDTPEAKLESERKIILGITEKIFGKQTNWKPPVDTIEKVESNFLFNNDAKIKGVNVNVYLNIKENLSVHLTRRGAIRDSWNLMKNIFTDKRLEDVLLVTVVGKLNLVDQYGKRSRDKVIQISMNSDVAQKIEWDNVVLENYQKIFNEVETVWLHPALRD